MDRMCAWLADSIRMDRTSARNANNFCFFSSGVNLFLLLGMSAALAITSARVSPSFMKSMMRQPNRVCQIESSPRHEPSVEKHASYQLHHRRIWRRKREGNLPQGTSEMVAGSELGGGVVIGHQRRRCPRRDYAAATAAAAHRAKPPGGAGHARRPHSPHVSERGKGRTNDVSSHPPIDKRYAPVGRSRPTPTQPSCPLGLLETSRGAHKRAPS